MGKKHKRFDPDDYDIRLVPKRKLNYHPDREHEWGVRDGVLTLVQHRYGCGGMDYRAVADVESWAKWKGPVDTTCGGCEPTWTDDQYDALIAEMMTE